MPHQRASLGRCHSLQEARCGRASPTQAAHDWELLLSTLQAWAPIFFPNMGSGASVIRAVRALRPLRALKRMPGMPKLIGSMLSSIP